jgi:long-chain acyl-CoA synthetase
MSHSIHYANVSEASSIGAAFWRRVELEPDTVIYRYAVASSASATRLWREETYRMAGEKVAKLAHYLAAKGVGVGTPVAIISNTRLEWMWADMALQTLGAIAVSVYHSLTPTEAGFIIFDSGAEIVFIENEEQARKIDWLLKNPCPIPAREELPASDEKPAISTVISFETTKSLPNVEVVRDIVCDSNLSTSPPAIPTTLSRSSVASYVYTSGTTGPPKGVIQTHGNHLANIEQAAISGVFAGDGSLFLYLPLAHSLARLIYYIGYLTSTSLVLPAVIDHHSSKLDLASIARDIKEGNATIVPSVPRLFEKMASVIKTRAEGRSISSRILKLCISNAQHINDRSKRGERVGLLQQILHQGLSGIRSKISQQLFGAKFKHGISGGARLDPEVNRFFEALGIIICEGYGLTETCVATHVNLPDRRKIGSVGPAFRDIEVYIAPEDGEIWLKGPNVTSGYLNRPKATSESWNPEGWFKTGDVGRIDQDGFLFITDRKKELVITAGGKKIPPTELEGIFKRFAFISHALLYGDGKPYCVMLFTLNAVELRAHLKAEGTLVGSDEKLSDHPAVKRKIANAVDAVNANLASYESIKNHAILEEDFTIENGLLTPTLKMKRKIITERYSSIIEGLYLRTLESSP